jgi:hypothetical protein
MFLPCLSMATKLTPRRLLLARPSWSAFSISIANLYMADYICIYVVYRVSAPTAYGAYENEGEDIGQNKQATICAQNQYSSKTREAVMVVPVRLISTGWCFAGWRYPPQHVHAKQAPL